MWPVVLLFGPISALLILYIAVSGIIKGRKQAEIDKKIKEERELKEKAEKVKREQTEERFDKAVSKGCIAFDEKWVLISRMLHNDIKNQNYNNILNNLICVSLLKGIKLDVQLCERKGSGDKSKLIVFDTKGQYSLDIFKYLRIVPSPAGAWQAYLLYNLWHSLLLFWHANYSRRQYVYNRLDLLNIKTLSDVNIGDMIDVRVDLAPRIYQLGNDVYVSSCYWTDWGGLIREYVEVRFDDNKVVQIYEFASERLYEYDCHIMF
jgi:hypothetical protein